MWRLAAVFSASVAVVNYLRLVGVRWRAEVDRVNAYHQGRREGWYAAMRLIPGHDGSKNRSKADSIWN